MLVALAQGLSDKEIAQQLHVGRGTVHTHMVNLMGKLGVEFRLQALVFAVKPESCVWKCRDCGRRSVHHSATDSTLLSLPVPLPSSDKDLLPWHDFSFWLPPTPHLRAEAIAVALHPSAPRHRHDRCQPGLPLPADVARYHPDVAICSERNRAVEASVPSWVLLSGGGSNAAVTRGGQRRETDHLHFADLVDLVDRAAEPRSSYLADFNIMQRLWALSVTFRSSTDPNLEHRLRNSLDGGTHSERDVVRPLWQ